MFQILINQFKLAGLYLEILTEPIRKGRNMERIFQIDIKRTTKGANRNEKFRIYPGNNKDIKINIINIDKDRKQLVLQVKEPAITFYQIHRLYGKDRIEEYKNRSNARIIDNRTIETSETTPEGNRFFLMGVDERQLFIAQLKNSCSTVKQAHDQLSRTVIKTAMGRGVGSSRQGEWFFIETSESTRENIDEKIKKSECIFRKKTNIGSFLGRPGGNPHTADEIAVISRSSDHKSVESNVLRRRISPPLRNRVYVRGSIRHKDHKTIHFKQWREVIMNNEESLNMQDQSRIGSNGVMWFD